MPRTEQDLEVITSAIEAHMKQGERIGQLYRDKKIGPEEALNQAADADEKLYNINDTIMQQREEARQTEIDQEVETA